MPWLAPLVALSLAAAPPAAPAPAAGPVLLGLDLEIGHLTSTSDDAIRMGVAIALEEINAAGGVLGGRRLEVVERDNRANPARGADDLRELATLPAVVAVMGGRFSPVFLEQVPLANTLGVPLLDPWAAADDIVDNGATPNFVFRLSLRDGWAMPALLRAAEARGLRRVGLLLSGTAWGRSSERAARAFLAGHPDLHLVGAEYFSWGDASLVAGYGNLRRAGAQAVVVVANEPEGVALVKALAGAPAAERLPLLFHWGITGGDFPGLCGTSLAAVDLTVVQTFSFLGPRRALAAPVVAAARRLFGVASAEAIPSPVGLAHAYDLTHVLARAVDLAGSTDRRAVRDALERVRFEEGLVRRYGRPFAPGRHEALGPEDAFLARWGADGVLRPIH